MREPISEPSIRKMFTVLEELKTQNQTVIMLLQQLVARSLAGPDIDVGPLPEGLHLPLDTREEIQHLDLLVEDSDIKAKLVKYTVINIFILILNISTYMI